MKTTFSQFPGMFENPAPAKIIKKNLKYYESPFHFSRTLPLKNYPSKWMIAANFFKDPRHPFSHVNWDTMYLCRIHSVIH